MPSFDIVSEVEIHELQNAVDQTSREIANRFDFKGTNSSIQLENQQVKIASASKFQVEQIREIFKERLAKRNIDLRSLSYDPISESLNQATQTILVQQGIEKEPAKSIQQIIKDSKLKIQSSIQGDQIRVTGKKRDDLQAIMSTLRESKLEIAMQFKNFRD